MKKKLDPGSIDTQLSCAKYLKWLIDVCEVSETEIALHGWVLPYPTRLVPTFLLNGEPFSEVGWPIDSMEMCDTFDAIPGAERCRYSARHPEVDADRLYPDGFARFDLVTDQSLHSRSYRHAWYQPDPRRLSPLPQGERVQRVIGVPDLESYLRGGATTACRLDEYLRERFGRSFSQFDDILDWGCGSARVTRHLVTLAGSSEKSNVVGVDIDRDNVDWCRENIPGARFETVPLRPRSDFSDGQFDLVSGISVFTHLSESVQFLWLEELRRITREGAILLISIQGPSQLAMVKSQQAHYQRALEYGFFELGRNPDLDGLLPESDYYRAVIHSRDYVLAQWGQYFEVIDIVDSIAGNQDLVVMRRRG